MDFFMTDEQITWSHLVKCGKGSHEVIFAASPWGVKVRFNPCSRLPSFLDLTMKNRCDSQALKEQCSLAFQEAWWNLPKKISTIEFPDRVLACLANWRENQLTLAERVAKRYLGEYSAEDLPTMWARLTLLSAQERVQDKDLREIWFSQLRRGAVVSWLAADISFRTSNSKFIGEVILEHPSSPIHPGLRAILEGKLAKSGTPNALLCLLRLLREDPCQSRQLATIQCLTQLRTKMGDERTLNLVVQSLVECGMQGDKYWKIWFDIFQSFGFGSRQIMGDLIEDAGPAVLRPLLYIAFSEQCISKLGGGFLAEIIPSVVARCSDFSPTFFAKLPAVKEYLTTSS
jgi:hypothetical protein